MKTLDKYKKINANMKFSKFDRSELSNVVTLRNSEGIKGVAFVNYFKDDAMGNVSRKEFRWSFDREYWSSWQALTQSSVSALKTSDKPYLFIEFRYTFSGPLTSTNNVRAIAIDYDARPDTIVAEPVNDVSVSTTHVHIYEDRYSPLQPIKVNDSSLLGSFPPTYYLNRSNHRGTQPMESVSGLTDILNSLVSNVGLFDNVGQGDVSLYYGKLNNVHQFREVGSFTPEVSIYILDDVIRIDVSLGSYARVSDVQESVNELKAVDSSIRVELSRIDSSVNVLTRRVEFDEVGFIAQIGFINQKIGATDASVLFLLNRTSVTDSSLHSLTQWVGRLDASASSLTRSLAKTDSSLENVRAWSVVIDSSLSRLAERTLSAESSIGWLTGRTDSTESSVGLLSIRADLTEASVGLLTERMNVTDSSLWLVGSGLASTDASLYSVTGRLHTVETSLFMLTVYSQGLGTDLSLTKNRLSVTESSLNVFSKSTDASVLRIDIRLNSLDSSLSVITSRHNVTESSLNVLSLRFDSSLSAIAQRLNVIDASLASLASRVSSTESSVNLAHQLIQSLTARTEVTDSSLSSLDERVVSLETSAYVMNSSISYLSGWLMEVDASLGLIEGSLGWAMGEINLLTSFDEVLEASVHHLTEHVTVLDVSMGALDLRMGLAETSVGLSWTLLTAVDASLGRLYSSVDSSLALIRSRIDVMDSSLSTLTSRHMITEASLNVTYVYALGLGSALNTLTTRHNVTEASLHSLGVKTDSSMSAVFLRLGILDGSVSVLSARAVLTEASVNVLNSLVQDASHRTFALNNYVDGSLFARDVSINWLNLNKVSRSGDTVSGYLSVTGDVSVGGRLNAQNDSILRSVFIDGSLMMMGSVGSFDSSSPYVFINSGVSGSPLPSVQSGLVIRRGTSDPFVVAYDETFGRLRTGITHFDGVSYDDSSMKSVMLMADFIVDKSIVVYDAAQNVASGSSSLKFNADEGLTIGTVDASLETASLMISSAGLVTKRTLSTSAWTDPASLDYSPPIRVMGDASNALLRQLTITIDKSDPSTSGYLSGSDYAEFLSRSRGARNIDVSALDSASVYSYDSSGYSMLKRIIVEDGIILTEDVSTLRFSLRPTSYRTTFVADFSSYISVPVETHSLGEGPFLVSTYEQGEQVQLHSSIDPSGNVTVSWVQGTLSGLCGIVISI